MAAYMQFRSTVFAYLILCSSLLCVTPVRAQECSPTQIEAIKQELAYQQLRKQRLIKRRNKLRNECAANWINSCIDDLRRIKRKLKTTRDKIASLSEDLNICELSNLPDDIITPTSLPTSSATSTTIQTATPSQTIQPILTFIRTATRTPTRAATATNTTIVPATPTLTQTRTPTSGATNPSPFATQTITPIPISSPTPSQTPSRTYTVTPTRSATATPTSTPTSNATPNLYAVSDWDIYMLRLVNRARLDPAGEAVRLGSTVVDTRTPVPALAYDVLVARSARNHNTWMHDNLGNIATTSAPDSFSHYETVDGTSTGTPATSLPNYTGATLGTRVTYAGYSWGSVGENILTNWSSSTIILDQARYSSMHKGWWESTDHRNNMLSSNFAAFGFYAESRTFTPPRGNLNAPADNIMYATQNFGRTLSQPRNHIFGLLYKDYNLDGRWSPRDAGDPLREGISSALVEVFVANSSTAVVATQTSEAGSYSVRLADGSYDIVFSSPTIPGGSTMVTGINISGANTDAGDERIAP